MYREKLHLNFEKLLERIFIYNGFRTKINCFLRTSHLDLVISKDDYVAGVEVKIYGSKKINLNQIKIALNKHLQNLINFEITHGILVVSSYIEPEIKNNLQKDFRIIIIDRSDLYILTKDSLDLRIELEDILLSLTEFPSEGIFEDLEFQYEKFNFNIFKDFYIEPKTSITSEKPYKNLCKELKNIPAGKKDYRKFELKCEEILKYVFKNDLTGWHRQKGTGDKLHQFDLICRISSNHDFWKSFSLNFNSRYILFEFKNYSKAITQGQIYTTEKYLFKTALRSIGFIIAKEGADKNAMTAMAGALKENGKFLICLTPEDLCELIKLKNEGGDPSGYLAEKVDDFLIKLSR